MTDFVVMKTMLDLTVNKSCNRDITIPSTAGLISRVDLKKKKKKKLYRAKDITCYSVYLSVFSNRFPIFDLL